MRIGLVLPSTPAYSETFFRSKIAGLQASGFDVRLFVGKREVGFDLCPVHEAPPVVVSKTVQLFLTAWVLAHLLIRAPRRAYRLFRLDRSSGSSWRQAIENLYLNSHILPHRLDWIHFGFATMALRRENLARAMGAKMAVSFRGYDVCLYPLKHPGCYHQLWQCVDKVHIISDDLLEVGWSFGLPDSIPYQKITPAIDTRCFSPSNPTKPLGRPLRMLTVARLHWQKGLEYTLEALALLYQKGVDFRYTIIGEGAEYERLCFAAHQLGIKDRVEFAGRQSPEAVQAAMDEADLYLQYSIQEGFCNAVLEAQAMGLLCIVSDAEGLPENVLHGQTGWVAPKRRPELFARRIIKVIQLPEEDQQRIRQQAIERVRREFNLEKQREAFAQFFSS